MTDDTLAMLAESVSAFSARRDRARNAPRDGHLDRAPWHEMAEQGWLSVLAPPEQGGLGLGLSHAAVIARGLGRAAETLPYIAALMTAGCLSASAGVTTILEDLMTGRSIVSPAWGGRYLDTTGDSVEAGPDSNGYVLSGRVSWVPIASADSFLVLARGRAGVGLFKVDRSARGVTVDVTACPDGSAMAQLGLQNVRIRPNDLLLENAAAEREIERADLVGMNLCSAELLGLMDGALDMTLNYLRTRIQFGAPIGSLQALQHRAADLWIRRQLTEAAVTAAVARFDNAATSPRERTMRTLGAKLRASQSALALCSQALQLHGAIGFAEEYGLGRYVNRVLTLSAWFGNGATLRAAYAATRTTADSSSEAA